MITIIQENNQATLKYLKILHHYDNDNTLHRYTSSNVTSL